MCDTEEVAATTHHHLLQPQDDVDVEGGDGRGQKRGPEEEEDDEQTMMQLPKRRRDELSPSLLDVPTECLPTLVDLLFVQQGLSPLAPPQPGEFDAYFGPLAMQRHEEGLRRSARCQNRLFARIEKRGVGHLNAKERELAFNSPDYSSLLRRFLDAKERHQNPTLGPEPDDPAVVMVRLQQQKAARSKSQARNQDPAPPEPQQEATKEEEEAKKEEAARPSPPRTSPDPNLEEEAPEAPEAPVPEQPVQQSHDEDQQRPVSPAVRRGERSRVSTVKALELMQRHRQQQQMGIVVPKDEAPAGGPGPSKPRGGAAKRQTKRQLQQVLQQQKELAAKRDEAPAGDAQPGPSSRKRPAILKQRAVLQPQQQKQQRHEDQQQPPSNSDSNNNDGPPPQRIYAADLERMRKNGQMAQLCVQQEAAEPQEPQQQQENLQPKQSQLQLQSLFQQPKEQQQPQKPPPPIVVKPQTIPRKVPRYANIIVKPRVDAVAVEAAEKEKLHRNVVGILQREGAAAAEPADGSTVAQPPTRPPDASSSLTRHVADNNDHDAYARWQKVGGPKNPARKAPEDPRNPPPPRKYPAQTSRVLVRPTAPPAPQTVKVLLAPPMRRAPLPPPKAAARQNQVLFAAGAVRRVVVGPRGVTRVPLLQTRRVPPPPPPRQLQQQPEKPERPAEQKQPPPPVPAHRSSPFDCTFSQSSSICTSKEAPPLDDDILAPDSFDEPATPPAAAATTTGLPSMNGAFGSGFGSAAGHSYVNNTPPPDNMQ